MHLPVEHRPGREAGRGVGRLVYPVISRRSGGLSLGVNLFPDSKTCSFDCPYCEVFLPAGRAGDSGAGFSIAALEAEFEDFLTVAYPEAWAPEPVRDICLSGNGEPTDSPRLSEALALCARLRRARADILGNSSLVLITNSTGFLDPAVSSLLERLSRDEGLVVWAKLDAGGEGLFRLMSGVDYSLERIAGGILDFARRSPVVIQTMLCEVDGRGPAEGDLADYAALLSRLVAGGARIDEVHLYTFARPSPGGRCAPIGDEALRGYAAFVREAVGLPARAFGPMAELLDSPRLKGIER